MTTYVLVHGAWGGAHGFGLVRPLLAEHGHQVFTPSLTGIGERVHLASPETNLSTHLLDIGNHIFHEDLDDIVLLGFSYGGMVITGLVDDFADRIRHLVFLDALVPDDGQSAADLLGPMAQALIDAAVDSTGNGASIAPLPRELDTPEATAWSNARRTNQPVGTFTEPVRILTPLEDQPFSRTFIKATDDPAEADDSAFWRAARRAQSSPAWGYHEDRTNHMVPMTRPAELAEILLGLAAT